MNTKIFITAFLSTICKPITSFPERRKTMRAKIFILGLLFAIFCFYSLSYSAVPQMINYQGKLTTPQGALINGNHDMTFSIYDTSIGGTALWTETQTGVSVFNGIFSVLLGSVTSIPFNVFNGNIMYLGVKIGTDPEMVPRKEMVSVPYAYRVLNGDLDWDGAGSGKMYTHFLTDKVGIGTTSPTEKLEVDGDIKVNNIRMSNSHIRDSKSFHVIIDDDNNSTTEFFSVRHDGTDDVTSAELFRIQENGNVGIGTSAPEYPLHIRRDQNYITFAAIQNATYDALAGAGIRFLTNNIPAADIYSLSGAGGNELVIKNDQQNANIRFVIPGSWDNPPLFIRGNQGNVGIGTSNPNAKLAVWGPSPSYTSPYNSNPAFFEFNVSPSSDTEGAWLEFGRTIPTELHSTSACAKIGFWGNGKDFGGLRFVPSNSIKTPYTAAKFIFSHDAAVQPDPDKQTDTLFTIDQFGDAAITTQGKGLILRATTGTNCYRITVNSSGSLSTALVTCP